jgi:predicted enzyme related to lactoylglutathione lyase
MEVSCPENRDGPIGGGVKGNAMDKVMWFDIPLRDLDAGARFYQHVFGWEVGPRLPEEGGGALAFRVASTGPSGPDGLPSAAGSINGGLVSRDIGIRQPALLVEVQDLEATLARIVDAGGVQVTAPRTLAPAGGRFAYFEDPDGNVSGLWQWLPG